MSIASALTRLSTARDNIITALGNKGVTATGHGFEDFATDIASISSGVVAEALSVTANGTYTAPTGKAYTPVTVNVAGSGSIIPSGLPNDGATRLGYYIPDDTPTENMTAYIRCHCSSSGGRIEIDWGDSSAVTVVTSTTANNYSHTYAEAGEYVQTITPVTGNVSFVGSTTYSIFGPSGLSSSSYAGYNRNRIRWAVIGSRTATLQYTFYNASALEEIKILASSITIGSNTFRYCYSLKKIDLTNTSFVSTSSTYALSNCSALRECTLGSGWTYIPNYSFYQCYTLSAIIISNGITSIGQQSFSTCQNLQTLTIPASVTSIAANGLANLYALKELHFKSATPPTAANTNSFGNLPSACRIYVPSGKLSAYTSAANYPSSSTYTYVEE